MEYYNFECGCSFPVRGYKDNQPLLDFVVDGDNLPLCRRAWDLFALGLVKGIFQLETPLGRKWAKRLKPQTIEHLSALTAVLRPGCLNAKDSDGISMTERYCRRKLNEEEITPFHRSLVDILKETYQCLVYQEQQIRIGQELAGFTAGEADEYLRKGIGKKVASIIEKCKGIFIEKAKEKNIVTEQEAIEIFSWIEAGARYSFNKAHSVSYGVRCYQTAYLKAHWPLLFFKNWLKFANQKSKPQLEMAALIAEAKLFNIEVLPPDIRLPKKNFYINNGRIMFGLNSIKGIGEAECSRIKDVISKAGSTQNYHQLLFSSLLCLLPKNPSKSGSTVLHTLIRAGCMDWSNLSRTRMLCELDVLANLTKLEKQWIIENYKQEEEITETLEKLARPKKGGGGAANVNRINFIQSQTKLLKSLSHCDSTEWVLEIEKELFGVALTVNDTENIYSNNRHNYIKDFIVDGLREGRLIAKLDEVKVSEIKKGSNIGRNLCYLTVSDETGSMGDVMGFADCYDKYYDLLTEGSIVELRLNKSKKGDIFILQEVNPLTSVDDSFLQGELDE